jgi:hypothetical protein
MLRLNVWAVVSSSYNHTLLTLCLILCRSVAKKFAAVALRIRRRAWHSSKKIRPDHTKRASTAQNDQLFIMEN